VRIGIMQPYFFPYLGYFSLIKKTDKFIFLDGVQYIRHGWINRNRILKPEQGWQYITVPLIKNGLGTLISDMEIDNRKDWKGRILRQLEHYKSKAPFYRDTLSLVESCLSLETRSIVDLNEHILKEICRYLHIPADFGVFSKMDLQLETIQRPGDWALEISRSVEAEEYVNPIGGKGIFEIDQFEKNGIRLRFLLNNLRSYKQRRDRFEPGLSIIDVLMFNDIEATRHLIDDILMEEPERSRLPCPMKQEPGCA
jgi:hypothetical protein